MGIRFFPPSPGAPRKPEQPRAQRAYLRKRQTLAEHQEARKARQATAVHRKDSTTARVSPAPAGPTPPPLAVRALNRLGYGPRAGDIAAFNALGGNDTARLTAWVDQQLDPGSINDSVLEARLASSGYTTLHKNLSTLWQHHVVPEPDWEYYILPFYETLLTTFHRCIWSKKQLYELTVRFWHDHFSIYGEDIGPGFADYDRTAIRPHAFGNFRTMLHAVAKHPAMLEYLDNKHNTYEPYLENDGLNENYARELLELHTLGAEHYFKNTPPGQVPTTGGIADGYTDSDVTAAARCLTGWTISDAPWDEEVGNTGLFLAIQDWHDDENNKVVLGQNLTSRNVLTDGEQLLNLLAAHPGTARFIARKLCRRLVADHPSQALVDGAATVFRNNVNASDQIARTIRYIVLSNEFRNTWGEKIKRPFEAMISAYRAAGDTRTWVVDDNHLGTLWWAWLGGNRPFAWGPPNGYPDIRDAWISSSPRVMAWDFCNWIPIEYVAEWGGDHWADVVAQTPASPRTANAIVDFWIQRIYGRAVEPAERQILVDFLRNGQPANVPLDFSEDWNTPDRLRCLVGLMFMSPTFLFL